MKPLDPYHRLMDYLWLKVLETCVASLVSKVRIRYICAQWASTAYTRLRGDFEGFVVSGGWGGAGVHEERMRGEHCPWGLDRPPVLSWICFSLSPFSLLNFPLLCLPLALATLQSLTCMLQCSPWLSSTQYEGPKASLLTPSRFLWGLLLFP